MTHGRISRPLVVSHTGSMTAWRECMTRGRISREAFRSRCWDTQCLARTAGAVVVAGSDGKVYRKVYLYDLRTGQEVLAVEGSTGGAMPAVQVSPDGTRIAVGFEAFSLGLPSRGDGKVRLYDSRTGQEALALKGPARLCCPEFSPDGERVAAWCEDGTIRVYNARTAEEAFAFSGNLGKPAGLPAGRYIGKPAFSPDSARIAAEVFKDHGSEVQVRDARTGQEAFTLADAVGVTDPMFSPDSARLAVWVGGVVRLYDARTGQQTLEFKAPGPLGTAAFSPDAARIAVLGGGDGAMRVYDTRTGQEMFAIPLEIPIQSDAPVYSPDGTRIAVGGHSMQGGLHGGGALSSGSVRVYDARTGEEVLALGGPGEYMRPVFTPDGSRIVAIGGENIDKFNYVVRVWTAPKDTDAWQAERLTAVADGLAAWHRASADESEVAREWYAAAFHLDWLIQTEPADGLLHFRRGLRIEFLGKTAEADKEFEKARTLKADRAELMRAGDAHAESARWDIAAKYYGWAAEAPDAPAAVCRRHALLQLRATTVPDTRRRVPSS